MADQRIKYSVIIPVYNGEKTLARCLDSLVSQEREDVQIVAVNDGSTDGSEKVILEFAKRRPNVEYIYQENSGVSKARNTGINHAKGEYITFVDGDDYVAEEYFSVLDQSGDSDLLVYASRNVNDLVSNPSPLYEELQKQKTLEQRLVFLVSSTLIMPPWNKRFRLQLIREHDIRFIEGLSVGEDFNFCMAYAMKCRTINAINRGIVFISTSDQNSLSRRYRPQLDDKLAVVFQNVKKTVSENTLHADQTPELLAIVDYLYVKHVFSCISEEFKHRKLHYFRDERRVAEICEKFRQPISDGRCGIVHRVLRLALKWRLYFPFYFVAYVVKGRKYRA